MEIASPAIRIGDKGLPPATAGQPLTSLIGRSLHDGSFPSPGAIVRQDALTHNIQTMADYCDRHKVELAPHGKTTMSPSLFRRQLAAGAWGITVATPSQGQVAEAAGARRIVVANQVVDPAGLQWLAAAAARGIEVAVFVDSAPGLDRLVHAVAARGGGRRPVNVLIEVGGDGGRTGFRDLDGAFQMAGRVRTHNAVTLAGVGGYEGVYEPGPDLDRYLSRMCLLFDRLVEAEMFTPGQIMGGQPILTAGGSAYFDQVVEVLGGCRRRHLDSRVVGSPIGPTVEPVVVLRSGCYVTHDHGLYQAVSPLNLRPALEVRAVVQSRPEPTLALLNVGRRDLSFDSGLPVVLAPSPPHWRVERLMDQHAFVAVNGDDAIQIGQSVALGISHPCTTFDKWRVLPVVDNDDVIVDMLTTMF